MSEKIWYEDVLGFMKLNNYYVILPMQSMTLEEKLNSIVRFFLYLGVFLALVKNDTRYLFFGIVAGALSVAVYEMEKKQKKNVEAFLEKNAIDVVNNEVCVRSTVDNPFMNPSVFDIGHNPDRPAACDVDHPKVVDAIDKNFNARLFKDVGDLYGKMSSQREFYTVPSTTIPNDQTTFAEWLYGTGATCKEGSGTSCNQNVFRPIVR